MIIWIASYPKSGNTWVRSIISSYFFSKTGNFNFSLLKNISLYPGPKYFNTKIRKPGEVSLFWEMSQKNIIQNQRITFLKTHNALVALNNRNFTTEKTTLGAIYIIRDPRNILSSLKNHYGFKDYNEALEFMTNKKKYIWDVRKEKDFSGFQFLGSWSDHYKSWIENTKFKTLLLKYEDLENDCYSTSHKLIKYILLLNGKNKVDEKKLFKSVETTKFDILKKKEKETGFDESIKVNNINKSFFFLGPENKWKNKLPKEILSKAEKEFEDDLNYFSY
ncbi:sulfotransferase domain-containing protein [Candidatus Pelagibacter sp.]|nr:sulfotransferase domain-containing protein [Candidatus Pelagibacter sp.]